MCRFWHVPSNGVIAKIALHDLDLLFRGKKIKNNDILGMVIARVKIWVRHYVDFVICYQMVCMQCSVDVTKSVVELLRVWYRYAGIPLAGLIEPLFRWPLVPMGMSCNQSYKLYLTTDFDNFCCKKFSN